MTFRPLLALAALPLLAGCPAPTASTGLISNNGGGLISNDAGGLISNNLGGLLAGAVVTPAEQELRDIQTRGTAMTFPVRMGVVFYGYGSPLKDEDAQAAFDDARQGLLAGGDVKEVFQIPGAYVGRDTGLDGMRKLAARFQADVLLIVSGSSQLVRADVQTRGPFDFFSNKVDYEARTSLSGLGLDVYAGTFLAPVEVADKAGPLALDGADAGYATARYGLEKQAAMGAYAKLRDAVKAGLAARKAELAAAK